MSDQCGVETVTRPASPGPPTTRAAAPPLRMVSELALAYSAQGAALPFTAVALFSTSCAPAGRSSSLTGRLASLAAGAETTPRLLALSLSVATAGFVLGVSASADSPKPCECMSRADAEEVS